MKSKYTFSRHVALQSFFILLKMFNLLYYIFFPFFIRKLLLNIANFKTGKNTVIQACRFFSFGKLTVGNNTIINKGCYLDNRRGIFIGDNVVIAHDSKIYTLGHDYNDSSFVTKGAPVHIEDYVIVFANVTIMPGVKIEKGAVVLPGAVVTKNVAKMSVVGGNPAKHIKEREALHIERSQYKYWFSI